MPILTKKFGIPPHFSSNSEYQYGIGLCIDGQHSYFYCCTSSTLHYTCETAHSDIFRLKINGQLYYSNDWEFVGKVDFLCQNNTISPCGKYFWSIEEKKTDRWQLIFRLVNIKTLEYEKFETTELDPNAFSVHYLRIHYTSHSGTFLIVRRGLYEGIYHKTGDIIFSFHVNKSQKCIKLEQIHFPNIPTVEPVAYAYYSRNCFKKFSYGIAEDSFSVFFYQIDYFGDLFVSEWSDKPLKWTKFTVEGDQFETWMSTEDRDLPNRQPRNTFNGWSYIEGNICNNERIFFENGYLCCTRRFDGDERRTHFYHCDFNIETRVCRSKRIFSTYNDFHPVHNDAIFSKTNGLEMLFLCNRHRYIFKSEQVILNRIPTLLNLTYLATLRMTEEKKTKTRKTPSTVNEHTGPKTRIVIELKSNICKEQKFTIFPIITYSQVNDLLTELNDILV